jgi:hypothetical protein
MKAIGFDRPFYIVPFDYRGSVETKATLCGPR